MNTVWMRLVRGLFRRHKKVSDDVFCPMAIIFSTSFSAEAFSLEISLKFNQNGMSQSVSIYIKVLVTV